MTAAIGGRILKIVAGVGLDGPALKGLVAAAGEKALKVGLKAAGDLQAAPRSHIK